MQLNKEYIKHIKELQDTDTDESYKKGLWDMACFHVSKVENGNNDEYLDATYHALQELFNNIINN